MNGKKVKIIVEVAVGTHRFNTLIDRLKQDYYVYEITSDENELLAKKRLCSEFSVWLQEQDFTNPDVSIFEWVNGFFEQKKNEETN